MLQQMSLVYLYETSAAFPKESRCKKAGQQEETMRQALNTRRVGWVRNAHRELLFRVLQGKYVVNAPAYEQKRDREQ